MKRRKRIVSFLLAIIMILSCFQPVFANHGDDITVKVRVELMDSTIVPLTEVTLPSSNKSFEEYGISGQADPGFNTPVHAMAQYLMDEWGTTPSEMSSLLEIQYSNFSKICGMYADGSDSIDASRFWMFMVNDRYPAPEGSEYGYSMTECPLKNGDVITLYAMKYPGTNYYAYFQNQKLTAEQGEAVNVTLLGKSTMGVDDSVPLSGATLISSKNGESATIETNIVTNSEGRATISFNSPGTYTISAKRNDISRSYAQVIVTESEDDSDLAIVASDKAALNVVAETASNLTLPTVGASGKTIITWTSSDSVVTSDGRVTRGAVDKQVTLTATIEKGLQKDTRSFPVTVKAYTENEINDAILSIKTAISSSTVTAKEGKDTNLTAILQERANNVVLGSTVALTEVSNQPQVSIDGDITYGSTASRNKEVTFSISLLGKSDTGTVKVTIPAHILTAQETVDNDTAKLTWTKIKGSNTDQDHVTTNVSLPRTGDSYATDISWESSNTSVISNTGSVTRPKRNEPDEIVTLTATVSPGPYMEMYGYPGEAQSRTTSLTLTVKSFSQAEYDAAVNDVAIVKNYIQNTNKIKDIDTGELADLSKIDYDLQLTSNNSNQTGVSNVNVEWSSTNPAITVNTLRGKVTRPEVKSESATGKLIATISKAGYTDTLQLDTVVLPVTQSEIDDENAYIEKIAEDLSFNTIKDKNTDPNYITTNLQMVYRGYVDGNGSCTYATSNSGEKGISIEWASSNSNIIATYGSVKRPTTTSERVTMTATLSSILLKGVKGVNSVPVEIPVTVIPPTPKLRNITLSSSTLEFNPDVTSYTVQVPMDEKQITIHFDKMDPLANVVVSGINPDENGDYIAKVGDKVNITSTLGSESIEYHLDFVKTPEIYTITLDAGYGGTVSPEGNISVTEGENVEVLYTPDFGYRIDKIYLDGNEIKHSNGKYIIMNVTSNHKLSATFIDKDTLPIINKVRESITKTTKYIQDSGYISDWVVVGLANAEGKIPTNYLKNLSNEIMDYFKDTVNTKAEKVTDHERQILSVVAAGGNPTSIGGQNLVERVYNFYIDDYNRDITFQGINGVIYGLIAMDTKNYEIPKSARYSRDWMINYLLEKQNSDGGWDLSSLGTSDVDITAMTLQALAPYHDKTKVKEAVNKGIDWLSKKQQTDGGFGSSETVNSEAVSQTIIALCANGIDPTGKDFTKGGKNLLDALLNLQNENGSFSHVKNDGKNNIATEQGYLGLLAYDKYVKAGEKYNEGKTSVYSFLEISFRDSIPPVITTSLKNKTVQTSSYSFTAHALDDVDGAVPVIVKGNGKEIKGDNNNYSVTLKEGKNTITLSAVDENGNKVEKTYTITYEPKKDQDNTNDGKKDDDKKNENTSTGKNTNTKVNTGKNTNTNTGSTKNETTLSGNRSTGGTSTGDSSTDNEEESTESEAIQNLRKE
ncbi:hypothetical protein GC105_16455, partial [Alkalibaculum sp. M08DMB]